MARWLKCLSLVAGGLSAATSAGLTSQALAQGGAMTELYGYAVHRFYAGDYAEAQRALNIVVEAGIEDPRPHYFRGLTQHQLGMLDAAKADFDHAADLEAHGRRSVRIDESLQRIQGPVRQEIEMARMMARVAVDQEQIAKGQMPPDALRALPSVPAPPAGGPGLPPSLGLPSEVPTAPVPTAPVPAAPVPAPSETPVVPDSQVNPFQDEPAAVPAAPPATTPATPPAAPPAEANPFESDAAPAVPAAPAAPAEADPFSTPAAPAASEPAPAAPAAPAADDPFSTPAAPPAAPPADANPF